MIRSIQQNTESHGAASEAVADAVTRILEIARKSGERIPEVVSSLESLRAEARSLAGATGSADQADSPSNGGA
jgi:methyl-accepting chemotaxis protein